MGTIIRYKFRSWIVTRCPNQSLSLNVWWHQDWLIIINRPQYVSFLNINRKNAFQRIFFGWLLSGMTGLFAMINDKWLQLYWGYIFHANGTFISWWPKPSLYYLHTSQIYRFIWKNDPNRKISNKSKKSNKLLLSLKLLYNCEQFH